MALPSSLPNHRASAGLTLAGPPATPEAGAASRTLWCALHFPHLALAACGADETAAAPQAITESDTAQAQLLDVNAAARSKGVQRGMRVAAALALIPALDVRVRDATQEARLLDRLAAWCEQFTPTVCIAPPDGLSLEVAGSAHLFGGAHGLQQRIRDALKALHHSAGIALAPTPGAAEWLVRSGHEVVVTTDAQLPAALGGLPLAALPWPATWYARFGQLGLRRLRDVFRLPRDGLARRFGPELLRTWDRALGHAPDPRQPRRAPVRFSAIRELPAETSVTAQLLPYIESLFDALCTALRQHDASVGNAVLEFRHQGVPATRLPLGLLVPTRDATRWRQLAQEALQKRVLPEAATELTLTSGVFLRHAPPPADLFERAGRSGEDLEVLMDKLRARLGWRAIARLRVLADHRPEYAWQCGEQTQSWRMRNTASRPLWLLEQPQRLQVCERSILLQGKPLTLLDGIERIESGWWDGCDLARDYYPAHAADGRRLWVYRERGTDRWFVHGLFA
ncbi:MAG TPA: DNA polymerase Y family protein [Gammaproteobacteria bacterium]